MGNDVLGLDVEVGNTAAMEKCDTLYQLPAKIHNLAAKHSECESMI
jgi:thymidine phosphorylase